MDFRIGRRGNRVWLGPPDLPGGSLDLSCVLSLIRSTGSPPSRPDSDIDTIAHTLSLGVTAPRRHAVFPAVRSGLSDTGHRTAATTLRRGAHLPNHLAASVITN